mgnify:CR=1
MLGAPAGPQLIREHHTVRLEILGRNVLEVGTPTAQFLQTNQTSHRLKTPEGKTGIADKNNLYSNHLINIL